MKIFSLVVVIIQGQYAPTASVPDTTTGEFREVSCWHCDAVNMTQCDMIGEMKPCLGENDVCMIEVRKREGELEQICMGCKSRRACLDNKKQNARGRWRNHQCRPEPWWKKAPSVCRQCCNDSDNCARDFVLLNDGFGPFDQSEWNEDLLL
ncbi:Oidioi.mRNA.OKI2018_I69.chr2.g7867.t1.cds [Oikopleura dioica]|uniref:Oidioi.mRNA.OKI2018_I69.chr2.g7867.t1.cds n=1 Tax=Oikopleura dioica TaxID=34765 RepID=A0ABN7TAX6_OIKDI|nr:Oidioi.mRNA.OKI2018_I69.chr2.g7867.t1.cds [Oikopleura dioica]